MLTKKEIGKGLKQKRLKQSRSINSFKKIGLRYEEIKAIEEGSGNSTVGKYLLYYNALMSLNK
jgi:hypothetical protein